MPSMIITTLSTLIVMMIVEFDYSLLEARSQQVSSETMLDFGNSVHSPYNNDDNNDECM